MPLVNSDLRCSACALAARKELAGRRESAVCVVWIRAHYSALRHGLAQVLLARTAFGRQKSFEVEQ